VKLRAFWGLALGLVATTVLLSPTLDVRPMVGGPGGVSPLACADAAVTRIAAFNHLSLTEDADVDRASVDVDQASADVDPDADGTPADLADADIRALLRTAGRPQTVGGGCASGDLCPPLSPPTGSVVTVSTEAELRGQAYTAAAGTTIMVSPGIYNMGDVIHIVNDNITIRGATGNRDDVILDGGGMLATGRYHVILIEADDVTIADLTIRNGDEHGVSINGSDRPTLYNLRILDTGYQLVKVNPIGDGSDDGLLACSRLEYTTTSPEDYTNGISAHNAHDWTVRDNAWYRIRTPGNAAVPTILFWSGSSGTVVERNLLVDCYQGISFGNASHGAGDHTGGIVRNNFIYASQPHDVVVEMVHASGWLVAHNTALLLSPDGVTHGMEARFSDSSGSFAYNLSNMAIWLNRDGAHGTGIGNVTNAQSSWFVDASSADLHLVASATGAIDWAATLPEVSDDYDGDTRPHGSAPDVGADEYGVSTPSASLSLIAPTGSTAWPIDSQRLIRWATTGSVPQVDLYYSTNSFVTSDTVDSGVTNTGVYTWTTPSATTRSARLRVVSSADPGIQSTGGPFILYDPATLTHTAYLPVVLNNHVPQLSGQRVYSTQLTYRGAFAYPSGDDWAYSGHALAYYPDGDPSGPADGYPGSLYAAGHAWYDLVGEITIPEPVRSDDFGDLPEASVLRSLTDITAGWKDNCSYNDDCMYREVDGLEYLPNAGKVAWNLRDWYNVAAYDQDSLGWSDLDMGGAQGVWHIGERPSDGNVFHNAKACDYLLKAPEGFASENLDGKWLIAGNHREAGALGGSQGPTLYAFAPWEDGSPPASGQNLDAVALLYYPEIYPGCLDNPDECHFPDYRPKDSWGGGAWVQTANRSGVLVFGRKGLGDNCYGTQAECGGDPCDMYKGYHAYPYEPQILFYDPSELAEVAAGTREPWEVLPYEIYSPVDEVLDRECATFGAVAYDQVRRHIYATEREAGPSGETVVHVWSVEE